jgi:hypothetical protein
MKGKFEGWEQGEKLLRGVMSCHWLVWYGRGFRDWEYGGRDDRVCSVGDC